MSKALKSFKSRTIARPDVRLAYDALDEEFQLLDQILKARAESGLTQAQVAERIGTTQSAVARMESAFGKHSPSMSTLKRYASALGYKVQVRLVKERGLTSRSARTRTRAVRAS